MLQPCHSNTLNDSMDLIARQKNKVEKSISLLLSRVVSTEMIQIHSLDGC